MTKATRKKTSYIYTLSDPRDGEVRYVGATVDPKKRSSAHRPGPYMGRKVAVWIRALFEAGLRPELAVIEKCPTVGRGYREEFWINYFQEQGASLLNAEGVHHKYGHTKPGNCLDVLPDS